MKMNRSCPVFLLLCVVLAAGGSGAAAPTTAPAAKLKISKSPLVSLESTVVSNNRRVYRISPDGKHLAVLKRKGEKFCVSFDGVDGKTYDWILGDTLRFSADNQPVYIVQQDGKTFVVVGQKEGKAYHEIVKNDLLLARAGSRIGYRARAAAKAHPIMVIDSTESKDYDKVGALSFSGDGRHVSYAAGANKREFFMIDGVTGEEYDRVISPSFVFSPDGKHFAYGGIREEKKKVVVVVDWREQFVCDEMGLPLFSPDSQRLAYTIRRDKTMSVVLDGKELPAYDDVSADSLRFSPDSQRLAYTAVRLSPAKDEKGKDGVIARVFYVVDGKELHNYEQLLVGSLIFSPDSKHFAYIAVKEGRFTVVRDGVEGLDYQDVRLMQYSPDSTTLAYLGLRDGKCFAVVNGQESAKYSTCVNLVISPDSKHIACVAERNNEVFMVLDGVEGEHYDGIVADTAVFSADGKHLGYEARDAKRSFIVVDGLQTPDLTGTLRGSRLIFGEGAVLETMVLEQDEVYRLRVEAGH